MPVTLVFLHGWGFAASLWDGVIARLPGHACIADDRGYFGPPVAALPEGPFVAVAHSFGAMRALADPPGECIGMVALGGFDRFADRGDGTGIAQRILSRMIARLDEDPQGVLAEFRRRCGCVAPFAPPVAARLREDLVRLRDDDCRAAAAGAPFPILSLQGEADPLLPPAMRDAAFAASALRETRTLPEGGHLLPLSHPRWCAKQVAQFAERLA